MLWLGKPRPRPPKVSRYWKGKVPLVPLVPSQRRPTAAERQKPARVRPAVPRPDQLVVVCSQSVRKNTKQNVGARRPPPWLHTRMDLEEYQRRGLPTARLEEDFSALAKAIRFCLNIPGCLLGS